MKTFKREETLKVFDEFWAEMENEWFKVEVLQDYTEEDMGPSLKEWLATNFDKSLQIISEERESYNWVKQLRNKPNVQKIRFHLTEKPYTSYLNWEIEYYRLVNIPLAGEVVYLILKKDFKKEFPELAIPDGDFMIFDNKRVIKNTYNFEGRMISADIYETEDNIDHFLNLKNKLFASKHAERLSP